MFPTLNKITIDDYYNIEVAYDDLSTTIIKKHCDKMAINHPVYCDPCEVETDLLVATTKVNSLNDSIYILYTPGMSADAEFILKNSQGRKLGNFSCKKFFLKISGILYTEGHANKMFNKLRKYKIAIDGIQEVEQPFYYVGMSGHTKKATAIYGDKACKNVVASLPKDYFIELLAYPEKEDYHANQYYFIRTQFGLVGCHTCQVKFFMVVY